MNLAEMPERCGQREQDVTRELVAFSEICHARESPVWQDEQDDIQGMRTLLEHFRKSSSVRLPSPVPTALEEVQAVLRRSLIEQSTHSFDQSFDRCLAEASQTGLELCERVLNWRQIGRVRRQVVQPRSGTLDQWANPVVVVKRHVVERDKGE